MNVLRTVLGLGFLLGTSCVSRAKYDAATSAADRAHSEQVRLGWEATQDRQVLQARIDQCATELHNATATLEGRDLQLSKANIDSHNLQSKLDESTAIDQRLREELQRLGKNVDRLLADRGTISHALEDAKARLEELRKAQSAAEARTALYQELLSKFKNLTDAGQLRIEIRDGRMVLQLPGDVLFESGQVIVKAEGQRALEQIAGILKTLPGKRFQIAGHSDNVPISSVRFASNWALSAARAVAVVRLLVNRGVPAEALSAAGYGEFSPVGPNDTPDHRAQNRRIEITLVPDMKEFVNLAGAN